MAEVVQGRWWPGIGDPTVYGWATVLGYAWAGLFCALCVRGAGRLCPGPGRRRYAAFWAVLTVCLAFLAVNKQLDFQELLRVWAKGLAQEQGWYEDRRAYQLRLIYAGVGGGLVLGLVLLAAMRGLLRQTWLAVLGLGMTGVFVLVRASPVHFVDSLLGERIGEMAYRGLLEWSGILLITLAAIWNLFFAKPPGLGSSTSRAQHRPRASR